PWLSPRAAALVYLSGKPDTSASGCLSHSRHSVVRTLGISSRTRIASDRCQAFPCCESPPGCYGSYNLVRLSFCRGEPSTLSVRSISKKQANHGYTPLLLPYRGHSTMLARQRD